MGPLEIQFESLKQQFPSASMNKLSDGSAVIVISGLQVPAGWNKPAVTVAFVAPVGYPAARPDCFWTDQDLRTVNGAVPKNTGTQPLPGGQPEPRLWFSWHAASWNANSDNLKTYVRLIEDRLKRPE
jgi:Prokaryotic E2 family E